MSRAEKSRVWEKNKRTSEKPISTLSELHPFYLKNALKRTYERERFWIDFFKKNGIQPLEIEYETLVQEYQTLVPEILDFIGVQTSGDLKVEQNKLKKQADFYTEILIIYYRIYFLLYNFLPEPAFGCLRWIKHRVMAL